MSKNAKIIIYSILLLATLIVIGFMISEIVERKTYQLQAVVIESDGISDNPNKPQILTTVQIADGTQYDFYTDRIEEHGTKCVIILNDKGEVINSNFD